MGKINSIPMNLVKMSDKRMNNLEKDPGNALRLVVTDGKTNQTLEGVKIKVTDLKNRRSVYRRIDHEYR